MALFALRDASGRPVKCGSQAKHHYGISGMSRDTGIVLQRALNIGCTNKVKNGIDIDKEYELSHMSVL